MDGNRMAESSPETTEIVPNNSKQNIGVIISFVVVLLVASVVLISRLYPNAHKKQLQAMNQTKTIVPVANMMYSSPTPASNTDISNTQLDKDLQSAQGSLDAVDTNLNNADQAISNQSADTPQ
ncbi:MAG TPA: hypothetical protein VLF89_05635 [Candidatus Saccharimonadales bacterium]|nr:hypothetical protein [Candidatus Saccharimonadales bacterium]